MSELEQARQQQLCNDRVLAIFNNTIQLMIHLTPERKIRSVEDWASHIMQCEYLSRSTLERIEATEYGATIKGKGCNKDVVHDTLRSIERRMISSALNQTRGSVQRAAVLLKMKRSTLYARIEKLDLRFELQALIDKRKKNIITPSNGNEHLDFGGTLNGRGATCGNQPSDN